MATKSARPRTSTPKQKVSHSTEEPEQSQNTQTSSSQNDPLAALKTQYKSHLRTLHELFPDWNDDDLIAVLQEVQGDLEVTVMRITEGHAQQWSTLGKKSKKESTAASIKENNLSSSASHHIQSSNSHSSSSSYPLYNQESGQGRNSFKSSNGRGRDGSSRGRGRGRGTLRPVPASTRQLNQQSTGEPTKSWGKSAVENSADNSSKEPWISSASSAMVPDVAVKLDSWAVGIKEQTGNAWSAAPAEKQYADDSWKGPKENSSSWGDSSPSAPKPSKPAVASKSTKKGTWAEIAKPVEPPKPLTSIEPKQTRASSPKRSAAPVAPTSSLVHSVGEKVPSTLSPEKHATRVPSPVVKSIDSSVSNQQGIAQSGFPPGLGGAVPATGIVTQSQPKLKKEISVTMPAANQNVTSVGVTFGSLSLNSDSEAVVETKKTPIIPTRNNQNVYLNPEASSLSNPFQQIPQQPQQQHLSPYQQYYQQSAVDYSSFDSLRNASEGQTQQTAPAQSQGSQQASPQHVNHYGLAQQQAQQQAGIPGYPPNMTPANMASMYAAYFPIYMNHMNQFGGNPYAASNPAAHYNQAFTAAMNKGYMYPGSTGAAASTSPSGGAAAASSASSTPAGNQQQHASGQKPSQNTSAAYNAYYNMAMSMGEDYAAAQEYAKYHHSNTPSAIYQHQQAPQSKEKTSENPSTSSASNPNSNNPNSTSASNGNKSQTTMMGGGNMQHMNPAYYNQMMHAGYSNFVMPSQHQQQLPQHQQQSYGHHFNNQHQQGGSRQPGPPPPAYWSDTQN